MRGCNHVDGFGFGGRTVGGGSLHAGLYPLHACSSPLKLPRNCSLLAVQRSSCLSFFLLFFIARRLIHAFGYSLLFFLLLTAR